MQPIRTSHARRVAHGATRVASQIIVSVIATGCASALFNYGRAPVPFIPSADGGKVTARIADGVVPTTTLSLDPQHFAAITSMQSFTPVGFTPVPQDSGRSASAAPHVRSLALVTVLPPRRPPQAAFTTIANQVASPSAPAATGVAEAVPARSWKIAGLSIPKMSLPSVSIPLPSVNVGQYVPNGGELLQNTMSHAGSALGWLTHVASR